MCGRPGGNVQCVSPNTNEQVVTLLAELDEWLADADQSRTSRWLQRAAVMMAMCGASFL